MEVEFKRRAQGLVLLDLDRCPAAEAVLLANRATSRAG